MPETFELQKVEGHRREDRVMVPSGIAAAFEVIEPQLALEIARLDLDRPAAARDPDQRLQRRVRRQVAEILLAVPIGQRFLTQQPALAATLGDVDAHRREARLERTLGTCPPANAMPRRGANPLASAARDSLTVVSVSCAPMENGTATT